MSCEQNGFGNVQKIRVEIFCHADHSFLEEQKARPNNGNLRRAGCVQRSALVAETLSLSPKPFALNQAPTS